MIVITLIMRDKCGEMFVDKKKKNIYIYNNYLL